MELRLDASGTLTKCRETLNAKIAALPTPESQENKVVRMLAHYIIAEYIDPKHQQWQDKMQQAAFMRTPKNQGGGDGKLADWPDPAEPSASFSVDCTVNVTV